jgi:hypothetical protein
MQNKKFVQKIDVPLLPFNKTHSMKLDLPPGKYMVEVKTDKPIIKDVVICGTVIPPNSKKPITILNTCELKLEIHGMIPSGMTQGGIVFITYTGL